MSRAPLPRPPAIAPSCLGAGILAALMAVAAPADARTTEVAPALLDREDFEDEAVARAPQAGLSYPYIRCAALYRALRLRARDASGLPLPDLARPTAPERGLIAEAARARAEQTGLPRAAAGPMAETDIDAVAALYKKRFETLAVRDPSRWWNDALIETDLRACGVLLRSIGHRSPAPDSAATRGNRPTAGR